MSGELASPRDDAKADDGRGDNANGLGPSESQKKIISKGKPSSFSTSTDACTSGR